MAFISSLDPINYGIVKATNMHNTMGFAVAQQFVKMKKCIVQLHNDNSIKD